MLTFWTFKRYVGFVDTDANFSDNVAISFKPFRIQRNQSCLSTIDPSQCGLETDNSVLVF